MTRFSFLTLLPIAITVVTLVGCGGRTTRSETPKPTAAINDLVSGLTEPVESDGPRGATETPSPSFPGFPLEPDDRSESEPPPLLVRTANRRRSIEPVNHLTLPDRPEEPIRPVVLTEAETASAPEPIDTADGTASGTDVAQRPFGRRVPPDPRSPVLPHSPRAPRTPLLDRQGPIPGMPFPMVPGPPAVYPPIQPDQVQVDATGERVSLTVRNAPLSQVLQLIATQQGLNLVSSALLDVPVSAHLEEVTLREALDSVLAITGMTWHRRDNVLMISPLRAENRLAPSTQGRIVRVFDLNYAMAKDVETATRPLLSPVGQVMISEADTDDKRKSRERVIVEDLPEYMSRIECLVLQMDRPPRQVMIEAHILAVDLDATNRHGIDFSEIIRFASTSVTIGSTGFTNPAAATGMLMNVRAGEMRGIVEAIRSTTDSKTLATPRVLVLDGQKARMQIGERLGYYVSSFNDNQTIQSVEFLDVGVVLEVTPVISDDGQVLMTVKPEVSNGIIDENTGLPEEDTTEVETSVLLPSGRGIVIGGLIQELDIDSEAKFPWLGDLWLVGGLFKRDAVIRSRREIIVALVPRVVPYAPDYMAYDEDKFYQATTPLLEGPLRRVDRPWEARLPNSSDRPGFLRERGWLDGFEDRMER